MMNAQLNLTNILSEEFMRCLEEVMNKNINELKGNQVLFTPNEDMIPLRGWMSYADIPINYIKTVDRKLLVAAIDSSSIFLGDTSDGSIYAAKCGIALAYAGKLTTHFKIGPTLLYLKESESIINTLDRDLVKRMIRVRIERSIQMKLSEILKDSIILIDGSLKLSIFEERTNNLRNIVEICKTNNNLLIGISKVSRLKVIERLVSLLIDKKPSYIDISPLIKSYVNNLIGRQLLAKLSNNGVVIRVDITDDPDNISLLCYNDSLHNGYPETLRIAHHSSVFTKTEILATIGILSSKFSLNEIEGYNPRRVLLGKIGSGEL